MDSVVGDAAGRESALRMAHHLQAAAANPRRRASFSSRGGSDIWVGIVSTSAPLKPAFPPGAIPSDVGSSWQRAKAILDDGGIGRLRNVVVT
jgi:hypothetical protein